MKSWKTYMLLVVTGSLLISLYIVISELEPLNTRSTKARSKYRNLEVENTTEQKNQINREKHDKGSKIESDNSTMGTIAHRVKNLKKQCSILQKEGLKFQEINKSKLDHIIVNDEHKLLYCYVPKVACTNLKRILLLLTGKMNETNPLKLKSGDVHSTYDKYLTYLDTLPATGIQSRLLKYKKIVFVREPLERILSAFRNKFVQRGNTYFKERFGRRIIKKFRDDPSERSLAEGHDMTFTEFVQYLTHPKTLEAGYNEHWATFTDLCHPCHIKYDFIGKYETIDDDVNLLLRDIEMDDLIQFPERGDTYKTLKTEDMLYQFYRQLKPEYIQDLKNIYAQDYQLFDYKFPDQLLHLTDKH